GARACGARAALAAGRLRGDQEPGAAHGLEPDRPRLLAATESRKAFGHPCRGGGRDRPVDWRDALVALLPQLLAGCCDHLGERLTAADSQQVDVRRAFAP